MHACATLGAQTSAARIRFVAPMSEGSERCPGDGGGCPRPRNGEGYPISAVADGTSQKQSVSWKRSRVPAHRARTKYATTTRFCLDPRGMVPPDRSAIQGRAHSRPGGSCAAPSLGHARKPGYGPKNQGNGAARNSALNCGSIGTAHVHRTETKPHVRSVF